MRRLLPLTLVTALGLAACGSPSPAPAAPEPAMDTPAQPPTSPHDAARAHFKAAVAAAFGVDPASITVQPVHAGLPDNPYDALATGDLHALRADLPGADPGPAGFASASGEVALARHPRGLGALMSALGLASGGSTSLPIDAVVQRVAWAYPGFGTPTTFDPVRGVPLPAPSLEDASEAPGARRLVFHTVRAGATGSQEVHMLALHISTDGTTRMEPKKL
jgi:hypothetical protein